MSGLRKRVTYANVVSTLALFIAVGGATAVAAQKVGTRDLRAGSVTTAKIAREAVRQGKVAKGAIGASRLADGAVTTPRIADDAVTGAKVDESSLGEVPRAAEAARLGGLTSTAFTRVASSGSAGAFTKPGTVRNVQITAPQNGYLFAVASGTLVNESSGTDFSTDCRLNFDGSDWPSSRRGMQVTPALRSARCATNAVVPVSAGPHSVAFTVGGLSQEIVFEAPELDVLFVPLAG